MEEKQSFTTFDSLSVLALVAGVLVLISSIVSNAFAERKEDRAKLRTEQLAVQILANGKKDLQDVKHRDVNDRSPASVSNTAKVDIRPEGRIGMDPWGVPYYYRVFQDTSGRNTVVVFSSGPNRRRELIEEAFTLDSIGRFMGFSLRGDDIASVTEAL
jgi:hypothetical protein